MKELMVQGMLQGMAERMKNETALAVGGKKVGDL